MARARHPCAGCSFVAAAARRPHFARLAPLQASLCPPPLPPLPLTREARGEASWVERGREGLVESREREQG
eukprot:1197706-Rhodomonas_salina.1